MFQAPSRLLPGHPLGSCRMDAPGVGSPLTSASEAKLEDAEEALALAKAEAPMALLALQSLEVMVSIVL